ncbi:MAG: hypothetical protein RLO50_21345 [Azospirillaceae bacterium]
MSHTTIAVGALIFGALVLGACGESDLDRGLSGAAIGAGAGAVGGVIVGEPLAGAAIGGAVGGATGVLTDPSQIDLGDTFW